MSVRWFALLLGCLGMAGCYGRVEPEPIYIGHIAPFSGPGKAAGEHAKQAILLAVEEINKNDDLKPGRKIAVLHVDSRGDAEALAPEAVRLIAVNRVAALLGGESAESAERLGEAAQPYGTLVITPASLPAAPASDQLFSLNASQRFRGQVVARFVAEELKANRLLVLIDGRHATNEVLATAAVKELAASQQWTYKTEAEFKELVERASKAPAPDAILLAGPAADLAKLRAALPKIPLLFGGDNLPSLANVPDDFYLVEVFVADAGTPQGQEFVKNYQARFHEPPDLQAALAFDGVRLLADGLRRAKTSRAAELAKALAESGFTFDSLTGPLTFEADHAARRPLFVSHVQNGRAVLAKRYEPVTP